jgi:hypothetical protein
MPLNDSIQSANRDKHTSTHDYSLINVDNPNLVYILVVISGVLLLTIIIYFIRKKCRKPPLAPPLPLKQYLEIPERTDRRVGD